MASQEELPSFSWVNRDCTDRFATDQEGPFLSMGQSRAGPETSVKLWSQ